MSLASESHVYREMISEEINENQCPESSTEYVFIQKSENVEETLVVGEEIEVNEDLDMKNDDLDINHETPANNKHKINETRVYVDENFDIPSEIAIEYNAETSPSVCTSDSTIRHDWPNDIEKDSPMVTDMDKCETEANFNESTQQEQDADEETIATFVTANGQQLALYAVEDSEDIFAVAVYDESGEPPTNFQFLMKSDVERLIGEGAVRTVKKPTQIKKQLFTTHTPMLLSEEESALDTSDINENKSMISDIQGNVQKQTIWNENQESSQHSEMNMKLTSDLIYSNAHKESDVTYIMMDESTNIHDTEEKDAESDHELVEQSTVQYILFEQDQSDSELTFDEIQATLENLKTSETKPSRITATKKQLKTEYDAAKVTLNSVDYEYDHNSYDDANNLCNTLTQKHLNMLKDRQDLLDVLTDNVSGTSSDISKPNLLNSSLESESPIEIKAKRSRKQQLTSVNRDDSEIIIQPASFLTEEENVIRKRGKRKRRILPYADSYQRARESRRLRKIRRRREVEVIEIDVDEDERTRKDIVEITLDDNKEKCSSDKENEVIMVGDSDEESHDNSEKSPSPVLKCEFCSRNFRQRRALDTHLRVCSKSPSNALKLSAQKLKETDSETVKKVYPCKICQEKFDVVVALARHVRSEHSQRKKRQMSKTLVEREPEETVSSPEPPQKEHNTIPKNPRKKRTQHSSAVWDAKKLNCTDCGRWFPSTALLKAHCLQHATKKSEQQLRRCQLCKKLIKSRMLFIRHLRMHSKMKQSTNSAKTTLEKKLRTTRQTHMISTVRKRGRPRKL